jgi:hypothetical protein
MAKTPQHLLHLVFGGEVEDPTGLDFVDVSKLDLVGLYPNYATALKAWKGASMSQIDNASFKYVIVHLHRLMDPDHDRAPAKPAKKAVKKVQKKAKKPAPAKRRR